MRDLAVELESTKKSDMNDDFIRVAEGEGVPVPTEEGYDYVYKERYQVLDRTNVFVIDSDGKIKGTTVGALQKSLKEDKKLEVFILTDAYASKLVDKRIIKDRNRITVKEDVAHTLVFFNPEYESKTDGETVLVTNVYTARKPHYVVGQGPDNKGKGEVERTAAKDVYFDGRDRDELYEDDIVSLKLTKDDDKLVKDWEVLIAKDQYKTDSYKVVGGDIGREYSRYEYRRLVLEDANGDRDELWLVRNADEFGTITIDSVVTFHLDKNEDIDVIRVYKKNTPVTANWEEPEPEYEILEAIYAETNTVKIGGVLYEYVGDVSKLEDLIDEEITYKTQVVNGKLYAYDVEAVEGPGEILKAPTDGPTELTISGLKEDNVKYLAYGLMDGAAQKVASLGEVKTFIEDSYGVTFNSGAIKVEDDKLSIEGSILSKSDWRKIKEDGGDSSIPYRITVLITDKTNKVAKIAMYEDGKAVIEIISG